MATCQTSARQGPGAGSSAGIARTRRRGAVLVWAAIVMFVLILFVGLALDWGYAYWTTQKSQNAADAAALAGAQLVFDSPDDARTAAQTIAGLNEAGGDPVLLDRNDANATDGDIVVGHYDQATRVFTPTVNDQEANAVLARAKRTSTSENGPLPLLWGQMIGINSTQYTRWGIAVSLGQPTEDSIIALDPDDPNSFYLHGSPHLDLGEGTVQVDSNNAVSSLISGGANVNFEFGRLNTVGNWDGNGNPPVDWGDLYANQPYVADPYASLPVPEFTPTYSQQITGVGTFNPGYYPNGLSMNNGDAVMLNPGVYILGNGGKKTGDALTIRGTATLTGYEVMFYIAQGGVTVNGSGDIHITPPSSGVYEGIQFFQARDNTSEGQFNGTGLVTGTDASIDSPCGVFYFPAAHIQIGGNQNQEMYIDSIVANTIEVYGNGEIHITRGYDNQHGGDPVYLVE